METQWDRMRAGTKAITIIVFILVILGMCATAVWSLWFSDATGQSASTRWDEYSALQDEVKASISATSGDRTEMKSLILSLTSDAGVQSDDSVKFSKLLNELTGQIDRAQAEFISSCVSEHMPTSQAKACVQKIEDAHTALSSTKADLDTAATAAHEALVTYWTTQYTQTRTHADAEQSIGDSLMAVSPGLVSDEQLRTDLQTYVDAVGKVTVPSSSDTGFTAYKTATGLLGDAVDKLVSQIQLVLADINVSLAPTGVQAAIDTTTNTVVIVPLESTDGTGAVEEGTDGTYTSTTAPGSASSSGGTSSGGNKGGTSGGSQQTSNTNTGSGGGNSGGQAPASTQPAQPPAPPIDNCPNGDYSPSKTDGTCGTPPPVKDICPGGDYSGDNYDGTCGTAAVQDVPFRVVFTQCDSQNIKGYVTGTVGKSFSVTVTLTGSWASVPFGPANDYFPTTNQINFHHTVSSAGGVGPNPTCTWSGGYV